jgi:hypothetical protein
MKLQEIPIPPVLVLEIEAAINAVREPGTGHYTYSSERTMALLTAVRGHPPTRSRAVKSLILAATPKKTAPNATDRVILGSFPPAGIVLQGTRTAASASIPLIYDVVWSKYSSEHHKSVLALISRGLVGAFVSVDAGQPVVLARCGPGISTKKYERAK